MSRLYTFNPKKVTVNVAFRDIEGFVDGTFVSMKLRQPSWRLVTGVNGESVRVRNKDTSGVITLTLAQSSPSNAFLSILATIDNYLSIGLFPVLISDTNGSDGKGLINWDANPMDANTKAFSPKCYIRKLPDVNISNKMEVVRWEIVCSSLFYFVGGAEEYDVMDIHDFNRAKAKVTGEGSSDGSDKISVSNSNNPTRPEPQWS